MNESEPKISPLGESALVISFGDSISLEHNSRVNSLAKRLDDSSFAGYIESIPAYSSLTVLFDNTFVNRNFRGSLTAFDIVKSLIEIEISKQPFESPVEDRLIEISISFAPEHALDLPQIAEKTGIPAEKVIEIFLDRKYRVYMLGFLPGFPYMGEVDERIAVSRKRDPRIRVPRGSVGIAGFQTGIYPIESPGGWQIIGQTDFDLFESKSAEIESLKPGDHVKFVKK